MLACHARKPHLLDALVAAVLRLAPDGHLELHAVLVDGQRMAGVVDDAANVGVVELEAAPADPVQPGARDASDPHRVEHAEEPHARFRVGDTAQPLPVGRESASWAPCGSIQANSWLRASHVSAGSSPLAVRNPHRLRAVKAPREKPKM